MQNVADFVIYCLIIPICREDMNFFWISLYKELVTSFCAFWSASFCLCYGSFWRGGNNEKAT